MFTHVYFGVPHKDASFGGSISGVATTCGETAHYFLANDLKNNSAIDLDAVITILLGK